MKMTDSLSDRLFEGLFFVDRVLVRRCGTQGDVCLDELHGRVFCSLFSVMVVGRFGLLDACFVQT